MAENLTTENLKSASNLTVISEITDDVSVICAENDTLKTFPLKSINREELDTIKTDLEEIKPKCEKYKQNYFEYHRHYPQRQSQPIPPSRLVSAQ